MPDRCRCCPATTWPATARCCDGAVFLATERSLASTPDSPTGSPDHVAFPWSIVDRITPATTREADLAQAAELLGLRRRGVVVTEPFSPVGGRGRVRCRPPGVGDGGGDPHRRRAPYETIELRLLNGCHSAMAYLGLLAGHAFVSERSPANPPRRPGPAQLMPTTSRPDCLVYARVSTSAGTEDPAGGRWHAAAVRHRLAQIATDGQPEAPQPALRADPRAVRGRRMTLLAAALALAAWMRFRVGADVPTAGAVGAGGPAQADRLRAFAAREVVVPRGGGCRPCSRWRDVFGDLGDDPAVRDLVGGHLESLTRHGALAAASALG